METQSTDSVPGLIGGTNKLAMLQSLVTNPHATLLTLKAVRRKEAIQKPLELIGLIQLMKQRSMSAVMEIGSFRGGTLFVLCQVASPAATVVSLDQHSKTDDEIITRRFRSFAKPNQRMVCLRGDSHSKTAQGDVANALNGEQLSFLLIDGDHTYEGVKQDFEFFSPFVDEGGLIAFHDIVDNARRPSYGVRQFWDEIKVGYRHHEFVDRDHPWPGMGIGVLEYCSDSTAAQS